MALRSPLYLSQPLVEGTPRLLVPFAASEPLSEGTPALRGALLVGEPLTEGVPTLRASLLITAPLTEGVPNIRAALLVVEALYPVEEEGPVSTDVFPGPGTPIPMPGLSFQVTKSPELSTLTAKNVSGRQTRTAFYQYPVWHFKLSFEYMPDQAIDAVSCVQAMMGFFLKHLGAWDTWLFWDPDDNTVTNGVQGTGDAVTTVWPLARNMGGQFLEPVGQLVDITSPVVYFTISETDPVPAVGPYTITVAHAAAWTQDLGVTIGGAPLVLVTGAPAAGQYAVTSGTYTFNSAQASASAVIKYRYTVDPADYTIALPRTITFATAPPAAAVISADFQYYFVCHFEKDQADFDKFANQLWELQEIDFESVIQ